ncbi:unnamed protein product, partial [Rotaria socialis]
MIIYTFLINNIILKRRQQTIMCNKKIYYFMEKYAHINAIHYFIKPKTNIQSLKLNRDNFVDIICNLYNNNYLLNNYNTNSGKTRNLRAG